MKSLLILGAGVYGRLVKEIAELQGYDKIDFLDDDNLGAVGKMADLTELQDLYDGAVVAIGNPEIRGKYLKCLHHPITLIHPTAVVSKSAKIGKGVVLEALTVVNSEAVVGDGCLICASAVVNHNAVVGNCCQINCNAVVASYAEVPTNTKIDYNQAWD